MVLLVVFPWLTKRDRGSFRRAVFNVLSNESLCKRAAQQTSSSVSTGRREKKKKQKEKLERQVAPGGLGLRSVTNDNAHRGPGNYPYCCVSLQRARIRDTVF